MSNFQSEYLTDPSMKRNSVFPIIHEDIWAYYKKHSASFWVAEEVDLSVDLNDWNRKLSEDERSYVKQVLAFFSTSDFIVNENECSKSEEVTCLEYNFMTADKVARENIHSESYAKMIEAYISDPIEKERLKNAVETIPSVKRKCDWFRKYIKNGSFAQKEVAGAITEGIFFSGSFCAIFWLKKRGLMPGLSQYNELISRDENLHMKFSAMIYRDHIQNKLDRHEVIQMIKDAVEIEVEFCTNSLPVSLIGMNSGLMAEYIRYVADYLSQLLIGEKIFNCENPFDFMVYIALDVKSDFFACRVNAYAKQSIVTNGTENCIDFSSDY